MFSIAAVAVESGRTRNTFKESYAPCMSRRAAASRRGWIEGEVSMTNGTDIDLITTVAV